MVKTKTRRLKEFYIQVTYQKRNYRYKVTHQHVSEEEDVFQIATHKKIVVLTSKRLPLLHQNLGNKQIYSYNEQEITNKCLMNRIIKAIDQDAKGSWVDRL